MNVRDYQQSDFPALQAMHTAQGFEYQLPDLSDSGLWITRKVMTEDGGRPVGAILGRLTSEAFYLDNPKVTSPAMRMRRFLALHEVAASEGKKAGVDSVHVWLPPEVEKKFGNQLARLGWVQFTWPTFVKSLRG